MNGDTERREELMAENDADALVGTPEARVEVPTPDHAQGALARLEYAEGDVVVYTLGPFDELDPDQARRLSDPIVRRGAVLLIVEHGQSFEVLDEAAMAEHGWHRGPVVTQ